MIQKIKLHLQVHLREDIRRFGPLVGVSTEGYESFNAVFRHCSVFSNHLAPSRDIALQLAAQENMKHCLTGGWSNQNTDGRWIVAGSAVTETIRKQPMLQRLIGWTPPPMVVIGMYERSVPMILLMC